MKNNGVKNLKVLGASLCLGAVLLTGCGEHTVKYGSSVINYETKIPQGSISYDDLDKFGKIVLLELNGTSIPMLLMKGTSYDYVQYLGLKTGDTIIGYRDSGNGTRYDIGKELDIMLEINITDFLIKEEYIQNEYDVEDILAFCEDKVFPTLDTTNKELSK